MANYELLKMAHPANNKNILQATGDGFQEMYNNYVRTRLSQNEIDLSDLRLGYERATQDDRIRAIKLGTENLENEVRKSAIDLDIARQTKDDRIAQEQLKTANAAELLKQNKITSYFMPKKYQAELNQTNASASNLWANARATNFNTNVAKSRFNEEETIKILYSNVNEYSQKSGKKGEDAFDGYYNGIYLSYLDAKDKGFDTSAYEREISLLNKHKPSIMQMYKVQFDGANPYGNAANGTNIDGIFTNLSKEKLLKEEISKNNNNITNIKNQINAINKNYSISDEEKAKQIQELEDTKKDLEDKNNTLMNYQNTMPKLDFSHIYKIMETKTNKELAKDAFTNLENLKEVKNLINKAAYLSDKVGWFGINNKIYSVAANMAASTSDMKELESVMTQIKARLSAEKGKTLSKEYQNLTKLVDDPTTFANNIKAFRQSLSSLDDYIIGQALNIGDSYGDDVKNLVSNVGGFNKKVRDIFNSEDNEINLVLQQYNINKDNQLNSKILNSQTNIVDLYGFGE